MAVGSAFYAYQVLNQIVGAWETATAVLAGTVLLGLVLGVHGIYDLLRWMTVDGWPPDSGSIASGIALQAITVWRILELVAVVAFVALWLLAAFFAADPYSSPESEAEGAFAVSFGLIVGLIVLLLIAAAVEAGLVGLVGVCAVGTLGYRLRTREDEN